MKDQKILELYRKAEQDLSKSREELNRPQEDVVNYSVCNSARSALYHFLGSLYLLHSKEDDFKSVEEGTKTIDELIEFAGRYHPEINEIDFSPVKCRYDNFKELTNSGECFYCNDTLKVKTCSDVAGLVKNIVLEHVLQEAVLEV